jgi:cyclohexa-1,5-dienecarbonyl-CoA hydratase
MSEAETIHTRSEGRTGWVTLDRPPLNVLDIPTLHALGKALHDLAARSDLIVFRGAGEKGFSAGVEVRDHTPGRVKEMLGAFHGIFRLLWRSECITIAAVHGYCLGGGAELATFCDFVVAAESAEFGQPEVKLGCFPPLALVTYPHLVGARAAADLILSGRKVRAREAQELGLVTRVVADDALDAEVEVLLGELRALSPSTLRMTRRAFWQRAMPEFERSLHEVEELYLNELMKTEDANEGIKAFIEKRVPAWHGR